MEIYVVQPGDTIEKIASLYGVSVEKIIRDNGLFNPYNLLTGQSIVIVYPSLTYTVQEGDTLETIAASYNITVNELLRNNPFISDTQFIYPGEILTISYERTGRVSIYGYTNTFIDRQILSKTLPFLTYLSIINYTVSKNGEVQGSNEDVDIIQTAIAHGVIPLMHLTTFASQAEADLELTSQVVSNEEFQDRLFENVISILKEKGYYGIIISAQYITTRNQNIFYNYARRFSERLRQEGFLTLIGIDPEISSVNGEVVFEDINYADISSVVDAIIFLQYTVGALDNPPSPVISTSNLDVFLDYALQQIDPDKIVIGIPVLGYIWELPYISGFSRSNSITRDNVTRLAIDVEATVQFDEPSQNIYFIYDDLRQNGIQYIVWTIDARAVDALLKLILERGISAVAVWNIMSYYANIWLVINSQYEIIKLLPEF